METIHAQFITDENGKKISVVIPINQFEKLLEEPEDMNYVRLYDQAKKNDTGERISMEEVFARIESANG